jgi:hypothetical protein
MVENKTKYMSRNEFNLEVHALQEEGSIIMYL